MKYKARTLSLLLFAVSWSPAMAADPVLLEAGRGVYRLGPNLEILTDLEGKLTIDQITSGNYTSSFYGYGWDRVPNFGYSSATFWVRCRITNPLPFQKEVLLELANPLLDEARLFFVDEGASSRTITESKSIKHRVYIFPVHVRPHETVDLYLRVKSKGSIALPLTLFRPDAFAREDQDTQFALGIYYGLIAVMILYNLTLFIALRERAYLYYSLALFCIHGMLQFAVNGLARKYLPLSASWWSLGSIPFFASLGIFWMLLFCRHFLNTRLRTPEIHRVTTALLVVSLLMTIGSLFMPYRAAVTILTIHGLAGLFCVIAAGAYSWRESFAPARYYLLGWTVVALGAFIYNIKSWGWLPSNPYTEYSAQSSLAIEAILLALALSDRFNTIRQEKFQAQQRALDQERMTREAEEELLQHLRQMENLQKDFLALAIEEPGRTVESLAEKILETLAHLLRFDRGFITLLDRMDRYVSRGIGEVPAYVADFVPRAFHVIRRFKPPEDFFREITAIADLQDQSGIPFKDPDGMIRTYSENANKIRAFLKRLTQDGFRTVIPLTFKSELLGYMVGGASTDSQMRYSDKNLLEAFRFSAALAVRNAMLYDELSLLKGKAEESVQQLSEYIVDMHNAREHKMSEKTFVYLSKSMNDLVDRTRNLAGKNQPMLILGETGTGKEMVANLIHDASMPESPFVAVNCAAIPGNLWESEVFGHVKGAFTDAKTDRPGKIEQAAGGTIFFDEIGEMPLEMQPKMLRLIQERVFQRVGGTKEIKTDCRFIFATNRNLEEMQAKGTFRSDLYYRINVFQIRIPPLRERRADIPALAQFFTEKYCAEMGYPVKKLGDGAMDALCRFDWPGNVRELENAVIQAIVNSTTDIIRREDLPVQLLDARKMRSESPAEIQKPSPGNQWDGRPLEEILNEHARRIIESALAKTKGNKVEAAKILGLKRATFYNRLKELGM